MTDPTDKTLLEFVARFAGWFELSWSKGPLGEWPEETLVGYYDKYSTSKVPDYLNSVDVWLRDVWPKVFIFRLCDKWMRAYLNDHPAQGSAADMNADARSRCLALYRALEGRLP